MNFRTAKKSKINLRRHLLLLLLFLLPSSTVADSLYTRHLACEEQFTGRSREICQALEHALEWTWTGHAIFSPSYRIKTEGILRAYCSLPVTNKDTEILIDMYFNSEYKDGMGQAQINNGVLDLLSLLGQQALDYFPALDKIPDKRKRNSIKYLKEHISLAIAEDSSSIFNPSHPYYILRDGCP